MNTIKTANLVFILLFLAGFYMGTWAWFSATDSLLAFHETGHEAQAHLEGKEAEIVDPYTTMIHGDVSLDITMSGYRGEWFLWAMFSGLAVILALLVKWYGHIGFPWGYANGMIFAPLRGTDFQKWAYPEEVWGWWIIQVVLPTVIGWVIILMVRGWIKSKWEEK